jgi:ABC-type uncharacterized transport system substrate-binding protein
MRLLRELVPTATSIGVLLNPARPAFDAQSKAIQEAARAVRQEIRILHASSEHEIDFAFAAAAQWRPAALIIVPDAFLEAGGSNWSRGRKATPFRQSIMIASSSRLAVS